MSRTEELLEIAHAHMIRFHAVDDAPPILERGRGAKVWDVEGREYIDFVSGQICATIGHSHPKVVTAIREAADKMIHCNDFLLSDDPIELAQLLSTLLPPSLSKYVFKSTGSEANEVAIYMAKLFTKGWEIVSPARSFYGMTGSARASTYSMGHRGHGPSMGGAHAIPEPYCYRCPLKEKFPGCGYACIDVGFDLYDKASDGYPAAVIAEPILSAGGVIEPPPGYFVHLQQKARERGMLMILDEAQTGLGRTGSMFAFEHDGIVPDILTLSKTLGGGVPLSCTATSAEVEQVCFESRFMMGSSHTNDPLPTRVGKAVLEVLIEEDLAQQAKEKGEYLTAGLKALATRYELIGDIRGRGLLLGVEFVRDRETKEPADTEGSALLDRCTEYGLIANIVRLRGFNSVLRVAPPLTTTKAELDSALDIIEKALKDVSEKSRARTLASV